MKKSYKLNYKLIGKSFFGIISLILIFYSLVFVFSLIFEYDKLMIDKDNFQQGKIIKNILKNSKEEKDFYGIGGFNATYDIKIEPKKNCYYLSTKNGEEDYILGFKLESFFLKSLFLSGYYIYPKYDKGEHIPVGTSGDMNRGIFVGTMSQPCY